MAGNDNDMAHLCASVIESELTSRIDDAAIEVMVLDSVGSTNTWLKETLADHRLSQNALSLCATEQQTAGRGRRGKTWHTPRNGVTFSAAITVGHPARELSGLSLLCGAAVCNVLRESGLSAPMVKWPNDILVGNAKLAGILVEIAASTDHESTVIIGTGLNYRRGAEVEKIDQESTDLFQLLGESLPVRSVLIAAIAAGVYNACQGRVPENVAKLEARWPEYDALRGKLVNIENGQSTRSGTAEGIDKLGQLRVTTNRETLLVSSGNVSVRRA